MDQKTITVVNFMAFVLLVPATIILAWKVVSEKLNRRVVASHQITGPYF